MYEWDPKKNQKTLEDRGIAFEAVIKVWDDPDGLDVPARTEGEPRWARLGQIDGKLYVVIYTVRDQRIRIISARRARQNEEKNYLKKSQQD